jgi:Glycosyl transferase family 2
MVGVADRGGTVSNSRPAAPTDLTADFAADPAAGPGPGAAPSFSVLCSAYRCEAYLAATIDSVLAQTDGDWELIVVDNGMSEEIAAIVGRYRHDRRVRLIRQQNRGLIGGIGAAAAAARGRYLVPLDSDDQLMPEFCRRMGEVLDSRPEIDALSCDAFLFVDDAVELNRARSFLRHRTGLEQPLTVLDIIGRHDVVPYFAVFRRAAWFAGGGYAPGTEMVEDIGLFLRLVTSDHDVRVLPERLARYRYRNDSVSRNPAGIATFEQRREQLYISAAATSGDPTVQQVLVARLRDLRYQQALRQARWSFMHNDFDDARRAAGRAFRQRATARSTTVLAGMWLAPGLLRLLHPAKRRLTTGASRLAARLVARRHRLFSR